MRKLILVLALLFTRPALATLTNFTTVASYTCDGSTQTAFTVNFPYGAAADLVVTTGASYGTTLALTTDYTLSVTSTKSTATLNLVAANKCTSNLKISRVTPLNQPTSLRTQGAYTPGTNEDMFDREERQLQEVNSKIGAAAATVAGGDLSGTYPNPTVIAVTCTPTGACLIDTGQTSGALTLGGTGGTGAITVGQSTAGQAIYIGHATVATGNVQTIGIGDSASGTGKDQITIGNNNGATSISEIVGTGNWTVTGAATTNYTIGTAGHTGTITVGNSTSGDTISIGGAAGPDIIQIGNITGGTGITENVGTGKYTVDGVGASIYDVGASTTTGTLSYGGTLETGALTLGRSTDTNTINVGNGVTASGKTQTVTIASSAASGGFDTVNIATGATGNPTVTIGNVTGNAIIYVRPGVASSFNVTGAADSTVNIASTGITTGSVNVGASLTTGQITLGGASETGTLTLGLSTVGQAINIGDATVTNANTQTIQIGDHASGTGKDVITVGNTNGASSLALAAGTGGMTIVSAKNVGSCTLGTNCGGIATTGVICVSADSTGIFATKTTVPSAGTFTITGNGTDVIQWMCF